MSIRPDLGAPGGSRALPESLADVRSSDELLDLIGGRLLTASSTAWPRDIGPLELALMSLTEAIDEGVDAATYQAVEGTVDHGPIGASTPAALFGDPPPVEVPAAFAGRYAPRHALVGPSRAGREAPVARRLGHRWIGVAVGGVLALTGGGWAAAASSDPASVHGPLGPVVRALHPDWQAHLRAEQRQQILNVLAVAAAQSANGQRIDAAATYGAARVEASQLRGGPDAEVTARLQQVGSEIGVSGGTGSSGVPAVASPSTGDTGSVSGAAPLPVAPAPVSTGTTPVDSGSAGSTTTSPPPSDSTDPSNGSTGSTTSPDPGDGSSAGGTDGSDGSPTPSPSPGSTVGSGAGGDSGDPSGGAGGSAANAVDAPLSGASAIDASASDGGTAAGDGSSTGAGASTPPAADPAGGSGTGSGSSAADSGSAGGSGSGSAAGSGSASAAGSGSGSDAGTGSGGSTAPDSAPAAPGSLAPGGSSAS